MPAELKPRALRLLGKPVRWVGTTETKCRRAIDLPATFGNAPRVAGRVPEP